MAGVGVAQIADADARQIRLTRHQSPWPFQVAPRLFRVFSRNDMIAAFDARHAHQDFKSWRSQYDRLRPRLRIRQMQQSAFRINVLPFEVKNFAEPATGED